MKNKYRRRCHIGRANNIIYRDKTGISQRLVKALEQEQMPLDRPFHFHFNSKRQLIVEPITSKEHE